MLNENKDMETIIDQLFKSLDGKKARVKSGGLLAEGSMEGYVYLTYTQYHGLRLIADAEYNQALGLQKQLRAFINKSDIDIKSRDKLHETLTSSCLVELLKVTVGLISKYGIKDFKVHMDDKGVITYVKLQYEDSVVSIMVTK